MTEEQQLMWDQLRADPAGLCHAWARDILKSKRTMHRKADRYLGIALSLFSVEDISAIVGTWLRDYNLPLEPNKLSNFDEFHTRCGHYVMSHCGNKDAFRLFV